MKTPEAITPEKPRHDGEWVRVPKEPTEEMLAAAEKAAFGWPIDFGRHYKAMLAASPATTALGTPEGGGAARVDARIARISAAYERFIPDYWLNSARDAVRRTILDAPK